MNLWNLAETLVGSFFGAGFAFLAAHIARRRDEKAKEKAALNGLLVDLSLKRSLVIDNPVLIDAKEWAQDIERCSQSVLDCRRLIREARLNLRPRSAAFTPLADMAGVCNSYLHESRINPQRYQLLLDELRTNLDEQATNLKLIKGMKDIGYRRPGEVAYGRGR